MSGLLSGFLAGLGPAPPPPPPPVVPVSRTAAPARGSRLRWHVTNSLTGEVLGQLSPSQFSITEPLREASTGTLTMAMPRPGPALDRLADLIQPLIRSVVLEDGDFLLFCGPIVAEPGYADGQATITVADWRAWFQRAPLRPKADGSRRDYLQTSYEQGLIMYDLMRRALEATGAPAMLVDAAPDTGIDRDFTGRMLQRTIGECLDDVMGRDRGCEWFTYATWTDTTHITPHVAVAWPERRTRDYQIRLEYRLGKSGNLSGYDWPPAAAAATRVWAVDGADPVMVFSKAASPGLAAGLELQWESTITLNDGTVNKSTAFSKALGELQRGQGRTGTAEVTAVYERLPFFELGVGDRARFVFDNGAKHADIGQTRITQRVLSGGRDQPTQQVLTLDLGDNRYPDPSQPGRVVVDDEP